MPADGIFHKHAGKTGGLVIGGVFKIEPTLLHPRNHQIRVNPRFRPHFSLRKHYVVTFYKPLCMRDLIHVRFILLYVDFAARPPKCGQRRNKCISMRYRLSEKFNLKPSFIPYHTICRWSEWVPPKHNLHISRSWTVNLGLSTFLTFTSCVHMR